MSTTPEPAGRGRRATVRVLSGVFSLLILWFLYRSVAPDLRGERWADVIAQRPALLPLLVSFAVLVAAQLLHAFIWRRIAVDLGSPSTSNRALLHIYFVSSLARYVPGKIWQIAGIGVLAARFGMAAGRAMAASVIAQLAFLATGLLLLGIALPDLAALLNRGSVFARVDPLLSGVLLLALGALAVWMLAATPAGDWVRRLLLRVAGPRIGGKLGNLVAVAEDTTAGNAATWLAGYAVSWVLVAGAFVLFVGAFEPTAFQRPVLVGGIIAAAYIGGLLTPFVPAGAGTREIIMIALLSGVVGTPGTAALVAIASRIWFTASELLPLAFIPLARAQPGTHVRQGSTLPGII